MNKPLVYIACLLFLVLIMWTVTREANACEEIDIVQVTPRTYVMPDNIFAVKIREKGKYFYVYIYRNGGSSDSGRIGIKFTNESRARDFLHSLGSVRQWEASDE